MVSGKRNIADQRGKLAGRYVRRGLLGETMVNKFLEVRDDKMGMWRMRLRV
jgi:hypothetical protein